jgi:hypothetical protein
MGRMEGTAQLRNLDRIEHGLLLPILLHCTNEFGQPMLGL